MLDEVTLQEALERHWDYSGKDEDISHEIYHDDAVLEFPQSGERFEGVENFREWRRQYPAQLEFRIRRIKHDGDLVVAENLISYDGAPWMFTVNIMEFRGDKVAARAHLHHGWMGGSRVAVTLAIRDTCRPAGDLAHRSAHSTQPLAQEGQRPTPCLVKGGGVEGVTIGLGEPVTGARVLIDLDLEVLETHRCLHEGSFVIRHVLVFLGEVYQVGGLGPGEIDLLAAVEGDPRN